MALALAPFIDSSDDHAAVTVVRFKEFWGDRGVCRCASRRRSHLFKDIVDSTERQRAMGDDSWRTLRSTFEGGTSRIVEQFGGRVVQFTGDGVMAAFTTPSQALRAAKSLAADARGLGVAIRAGIHTGEAYEVEDQLFGACAAVAARVAAQAGADELLVTETVQDLVAGSGFEFRDAGLHELKGLGKRHLVAAL